MGNPIDCIKAHAPHLVDAFNKTKGERQDATDLALKEFEGLHKQLEDLKKSVNPKYKPSPYTSPDKSATIKSIQDEYDKKIQSLDQDAAKEAERISTEESLKQKEPATETGEGAGTGKPPAEPPKEEQGKAGGKKRLEDKGILNHLYEAKNVPEQSKEGFKSEGLKYETKSQTEANDVAKSIVAFAGIDEAVSMAEGQKFDGDVNSLIFAEALNRLAEQEVNAKTPEEKLEAAKRFAEVGITYDKMARYGGRFNAAIAQFYKKSPLGIVMMENAKRKEDFNEWSKPKDKSWKEFFGEMMKEPEFEAIIKEQIKEATKKERAESREARKKKADEFFDKAKDQFKGGATYSTIIPPKVFTAAIEGMRKAYHAGEKVVELIQDAIDYISEQIGTDTWDKEKFRKEWNDKLKDSARKPLTDEEIRERILNKFRNKLKGLSNEQKDDVIRRSHKKLIENGALEYEEFKEIIARVTGRSELTPEESARMKELVQKTNAVDDAGKKWREEKTTESEKQFRAAEIEAAKAARELNDLFQDKPDIVRRMVSIMQLNTLGVVALIANVAYNITNQTMIRLPVGIINTLTDRVASLISTNHENEFATVEQQKEFWHELGVGSKEALQQIGTGLNRQDYLAKEVSSQIRPFKSIRDLFSKSKRQRMSAAQKTDKILQGTAGIPAEVVARLLNVGDKPQRFAAEGAQAATFAKTLGLKGVDYKLFVTFPREEAYRHYKAQGLSDEVAGQKADYVKESILQEGKRSTFQQDNLLNDAITRAAGVLGGKDSGTASLAKSILISPYIKIPLNAFWSLYNLINPEVAILQSMTHAGISKGFKKKGNLTKAKLQNREARYWMAHAIVGMGMRFLVIKLVQAGMFTPAADDDESKKERDANALFSKQGTFNLFGLKVSNRWGGAFGMMGNAIAKKDKDMTPEQREAQDEFWNVVFGGMEVEALKELENGVFANSSSLLQSINTGNPDRYLLNTLNLMTNIVQPATVAQINRASLDEVPSSKGDNFLDKLNQQFAQRSKWYRNLFDVQLRYKRDMWGHRIPKGGNVLSRMFGVSKENPQIPGRVMYKDFLETNDTGFLPPAVLPTINGKKLNTQQEDRLIQYVGNEREKLVMPYINDMAEIEGFDAKYSDLNTEDKKFVLQYLYGKGRDQGVELFYSDYPDFRPKEEEKDYQKEAEKAVFKILQKHKK